MNRFGALVLACLAVSVQVPAAEVTRIASSFEETQPFQMYVDLSFQRVQELARITREWHQGGDLVDVSEMRYYAQDSRLAAEAHIGIWKDLELRYGLPIILSQTETWFYPSGTTAANSTIINNCLNANGTLTDPNCPQTGAGAQAMFPIPSNSYRGGLGNMTFGLAWAIFNQVRDDTKPTWVVAFDYEAPTAAKLDPTVQTSATHHGDAGDRLHHYKLSTALSRRYGFAEPYFTAFYMFPYLGPGYYSNCEHPSSANMARPDNCGTPAWGRMETGIQPAQQAGVTFGTELNVMDDTRLHQRVAFDIRAVANYMGPGRYYNELSYVFGKLLTTEDYLQVGGSLGVVAQAADYVSFKARGALLYNTSHGLTLEPLGKDLNGNGLVDLAPGSPEANPNFDYRADAVGRRFRITEVAVFQLDVTASFNF